MQRYPWPGNIRELENEIERCMVLGGELDELPEDLLSQRVRDAAGAPPTRAQRRATTTPARSRTPSSSWSASSSTRGSSAPTGTSRQLAKELGISRSNLITKVERYGLDKKS